MGTKTSVYLSDELAERWRASGEPLAEIIRRGLEREPPEAALRRVIREELAAFAARSSPAARPDGDCPHPKARVIKDFCGACGTNVGTKGTSR